MLGHLVGKLGFDSAFAFAIVEALASGGAMYVATMWPILAPFIATIQGFAGVFGISAVVGF